MRTLLAVLLLASPCAAQSVEEMLDVIEVVPDGRIGIWQIGGRSYVVNANTTFDLDHPATVGKLCEVEYVEREGVYVALEIEPQAYGPEAMRDGPYVFWRNAKTVEVIGYRRGEVLRQLHENVEGPFDAPMLVIEGETVHLDPAPPTPPVATIDMPSKLLCVSDIEGNRQALVRYLRAVGVMDRDDNWTFGDGHLLFNGDILDRGDRVTETLWLIRHLERQAKEAGGAVHYILGNHETMVMAGDLRYIHNNYRFITKELGMSYEELFGPTTEIGRWYRTRPALMKIGRLLFVHAGYSPAVTQLQKSIDELNDMVRSRLGPPAWPSEGDLATALVWDMQGPLWYRGYFDEHSIQFGRATDADVQAVLDLYDVDHIVIGHTLVDDVGWLDADKKIIAIDIHWTEREEAEGLLVENGELRRWLVDGEKRELSHLRGN